MKTKKNMSTVRVADAVDLTKLNKKAYCYAAERIITSYSEDFVNEDNGELVQVERNSVLFEKGQLLTPDDFSVLLFHFQSGDLKEAMLCDQQREGLVVNGSNFGLWFVRATGSKSKLNMLLRASNAKTAYEVAEDYIELNYRGCYSIDGIKTFDDSIVIEPDPAKESDAKRNAEKCWYDISIMVDEGQGDDVLSYGPFDYIVFADTVEYGKSLIEEHIAEERARQQKRSNFVVKMQEAKTITCNVIVPAEFCYAYLPEEERP